MSPRLGLAALFASSLFTAISCHTEKSSTAAANFPIPVVAYEVKPLSVPVTFDCYGFVQSSHAVEIRARVEGYLEGIEYEEGSLVREGELLFTLEQDQYKARVDQAVAEVHRQEALLANARATLKRLLSIEDEKAVSKQQIDDAFTQVEQSEALLQEARARLQEREIDLGYTDIVSPVTGFADASNFRRGALITPATDSLLTTVSQLDPVWVNFPVSDNQVHKFQQLVNQKGGDHFVEAYFSDGTRFGYKGQIDLQSPTYDQSTATLNVRAVFSNKETQLRPGQFLRLKVYAGSKNDVILVPRRAIMQTKDGSYVYCVDESNKVFSKKISLGDWRGSWQEIEQGLKKDDRVIVDGTNKVRVGQEVAIASFYSPDSAPYNQ